jgi:hypothetical protein
MEFEIIVITVFALSLVLTLSLPTLRARRERLVRRDER